MLLGFARYSNAQCNFSVSSTSPCGGTSVDFHATGPAGIYTWDFDGDLNIDATGKNVSFTYPALSYPNQVTVRLYIDGAECHSVPIQIQSSADPTIGLIPGAAVLEGNSIRTCTSIPNVNLGIFNASSSYASNTSYTIDWGDGAVESFTNNTFSNTTTINRTYNGFGFYEIEVTVESNSGCSASQTYTFYNAVSYTHLTLPTTPYV